MAGNFEFGMGVYEMPFSQLPLDVLPSILCFLLKPSHIASASCVSRSFHYSALPLLYNYIYFYAWQTHVKTKVNGFRLLSIFSGL